MEKAGGLPQLDIRLDNSGMDKKPSIEEKPHPPESCDPEPSDDSDRLLELLCDDDDDDEDGLLPTLSSTDNHTDDISTSFNSKFERLKKELLGKQNGIETGDAEIGSNNGNGEWVGNSQGSGSNLDGFGSKNGNGEPEYENIKNSDSQVYDVPKPHGSESHLYENTEHLESYSDSNMYDVPKPVLDDDDNELTHAPMFDRFPEGSTEPVSDAFDLQSNECYSSTASSTQAPPTSVTSTGGKARGKEVYEDLDDLDKYLNKEGKERSYCTIGPEYEDLDNVFPAEVSEEEGHYYELTDGGMMSRQVEPPPEPEHIEMAEMLGFKNLPPLVCTAHLGDEATLKKLADTAGAVLAQVVKSIHISLGKWVVG